MYRRFGFLGGDLRPDPPKSEGILKTPRAPAMPEGRRPEGMAVCPRGFENPRRTEGIGGEDPQPKTRILCLFFFNILYQTNTTSTYFHTTSHNFSPMLNYWHTLTSFINIQYLSFMNSIILFIILLLSFHKLCWLHISSWRDFFQYLSRVPTILNLLIYGIDATLSTNLLGFLLGGNLGGIY